MENVQLTISKSDFELLQNHLNLSSKLSNFNKKKLTEELKNAKVLKDSELPNDVVTLNSYVEIEEVDTHQVFKFQLVNPAEANMESNKLSVLAPIGVALLGYRTGAKVQWEMPNGLKTFKIVKVTQETADQPINAA